MDKILGLEYGADDYITKPFNILEVKGKNQSDLTSKCTSRCERRRISQGCRMQRIKD